MEKYIMIPDYEKYIIEAYADGKTLDAIGKEVGYYRNKISHILRKNNVVIRSRGKKKGSLTLDINVQKHICDMYRSGKTTTVLSKQYSCSKTKILYVLRNNNIKTRTRSEQKRKYKLDENSFKNINEYSLYWLGFIAADGNLYINPNGNKIIQIGLHEKDRNHLVKFKKFLKTDKPIYFYKSRRRYKNGYISTPEVKFNINSVTIFNDINSYGITPRKTFSMGVNGSLINRHFFRGLFDGDGSIYSNNHGTTCAIDLTGSNKILKEFNDFLNQNLNINLTISKSRSVYRIRAYGKKALSILGLLYDSYHISLDRKIDQYRYWSKNVR
jgi:intein-encoded DNA endonuclease-like protein